MSADDAALEVVRGRRRHVRFATIVGRYMNARRKRWTFKLIEVAPFDARRGYKRCAPPGVHAGLDVSIIGGPKATADFWRDQTGRLLVRFCLPSQREMLHLEAARTDGKQLNEGDMEEFQDFHNYVADALYEWVVEIMENLDD